MDTSHLVLKDDIIKIIKQNIAARHYKIFFFGSRANGEATKKSDIDIGIEANEKIPYRIMLEIKEKLDNLPTLKKFDFVDFKSVDDDFQRIAMKHVEVIYER